MQVTLTVPRRRALWRYVWAFPATLVGLLVAFFGRLGGATFDVVDGTLEVGGGAIGRAINALPGPVRFSAMTLGHVIIGADREALRCCRLHEQVHVRQYERWGVLFFPLYFGSSAWQILRGRNPYWHNRFEREAYREERRAMRGAGARARNEMSRC